MGFYRHRQVFNSASYQFVFEVELQLDSFLEYIELTEKTIESDLKTKILAFDKFLKEASDTEIEFSHDFEDYEIKIQTRKIYYHSLFISLYSFLERKMYQLCRIAEEHQSLKIKDISGDGIFKYYTYLKKVLGINLDVLNTEWSEFTKYNKLRNILVHSSTYSLENIENNKKLISVLNSIENLLVKTNGDYLEFEITDKELLISFSKRIRKFLNEVYHEKA